MVQVYCVKKMILYFILFIVREKRKIMKFLIMTFLIWYQIFMWMVGGILISHLPSPKWMKKQKNKKTNELTNENEKSETSPKCLTLIFNALKRI